MVTWPEHIGVAGIPVNCILAILQFQESFKMYRQVCKYCTPGRGNVFLDNLIKPYSTQERHTKIWCVVVEHWSFDFCCQYSSYEGPTKILTTQPWSLLFTDTYMPKLRRSCECCNNLLSALWLPLILPTRSTEHGLHVVLCYLEQAVRLS